MPQVRFTLLFAKGVEDADTVTNNDLYGVITYGGQKTKSNVAKDGIFQGFKYCWDQTFVFDATNDNDIEVALYDKDIGFDDLIGKSVFNLTQAKASGLVEIEAGVVTKKHEEKGHLKARIEYLA